MTDNSKLIEQANAALSGVTDGPWEVDYKWLVASQANRIFEISWSDGEPYIQISVPDADFIAQSRQIVPDLIAALEKSEADKARAVAEEREAIARLIETHVVEYSNRGAAFVLLREHLWGQDVANAAIAAAIRARGEQS